MYEVTKEIEDVILKGKPKERAYVCSKTFLGFALYYFSDYFTYRLAPFHFDFIEDIENITKQRGMAAWIGFRDSAKTSWAKMALLWIAIYKKQDYIILDSYDGGNSEMALYDVTVELQSNQKIIRDFGHLYLEDRKYEAEKKIKRVSKFILRNKVLVSSFSTQQSARGMLYKNKRPGFIIFDDCENKKTALSNAITQKIIAHIDEARTAVATDTSILFLGNYIREEGVVEHMMKVVNASRGMVRNVPVIIDNKPSWPDKYEMTDEKASEVNKKRQETGEKPKVSLETKKRELNIEGGKLFESEMMNDPASSGFLIFDRRKIDRLIKECEEPLEDKAGFLLWDKFNPAHRYGIGADTSKGVGLDSNASVLIDFSVTPNEQIGSYANNEIAPNIFAHELKREGVMFGECLVAPESNNTGAATLTELRSIYPIESIFRRMQTGKNIKVADKPTFELGWEANSSTVADVMFQLKSAVEDGKLKINDIRILKEMRRYNQADLNEATVNDPLSTRHFDLLRATAISYALRTHAFVSKKSEEEYIQEPYQPSENERGNTRETVFTRHINKEYKQRSWEKSEFEQ